MTSVTAMNAEATQAILDQTIKTVSIIDGVLNVRYWGAPLVDVPIGSVEGPPGGVGPTGDVSTAELNAAIATEVTNRNTAITTAVNNSGTGVVDYTVVTTEQHIIDLALGWNDVTSANVAFTPIANNYYEFGVNAIVRSGDITGGYFDLRIIQATTGTVLAQISTQIDDDGKNVGMAINTLFKIPGGWTGAKTFKLQARGSVGGYYIAGDSIDTKIWATHKGT